MSNTINIQYTKFQNLDSEGKVESENFGYRIYDDYATEYDNTFESFEQLTEALNEGNMVEFLSKTQNFDDVDFTDEFGGASGVYFNGEFYSAEELA